MANYVLGGQHTSSYWQEVARMMQVVNAQAKPETELTPQGQAQKPATLNDHGTQQP